MDTSLTSLLRDERPADRLAISSVVASAFRSVPYGRGNEHMIVDALRGSNALSVSVVAQIDEQVAGHIAASPVSIGDGTPDWYGLGPVSVDPVHQGRGIGGALVREALRQLQDLGARGCVVLGAARYYTRFGFTRLPDLRLPGARPENFLAIVWSGDAPSGEVAYHAAFGVEP